MNDCPLSAWLQPLIDLDAEMERLVEVFKTPSGHQAVPDASGASIEGHHRGDSL